MFLTWWSLGLLIVAALAVGHLVRVDEYVPEVAISAMLVLLGGTMWGVLERLLGVPTLSAFLLLPAYAVVSSLVMAFVVRRP